MLPGRGAARPAKSCSTPPPTHTLPAASVLQVAVLHYDVLGIDVGTLHTSLLVPPLLAGFYVVLGGLVIWADYALGGDEATQQAQRRSSSLLNLVASFG